MNEDLPEYLAESRVPAVSDGPGFHDAWDAARGVALSLRAAHQREAAAAERRWIALPQPAGRPVTSDPSGRFFHFVGLPRAPLGPVLAEWWAAHASADVVMIGGKLQLEPPQEDAKGGFAVDGRMRRFSRWHWVPVLIELWPTGAGTIMTMTPRARVVASWRYFRTGHAVLDRLAAQLATAAGAGGRPRLAS